MLNNTYIKSMFDNIARDYDKLNDIISFKMHLNVKARAIENVPLKVDSKILDVCTGTGDMAIYLAKNVTIKGQVTGIDFSQNMLDIAKEKSENIKNLEFLVADALKLPFKDEEFDACFVSFGLRNLSNLKIGIKEMKRVTKKNGFIVNLDTGKPKGIIGFIYNLYFFNIVPLFGKFFSENPLAYKYLPQSTKNFPSPSKLVEIFKELGLKNVKRNDFLFGSISQQIGEI